MAVKFEKKQRRQDIIIYTLIAVILLCLVFLGMISYFYDTAENEAYESLQIQTEQIKDDMTIQLMSDRENLATMASFAAKLYSDGEGYDIMFESFEPIGLIENIGILNRDCTLATKAGKVDLSGLISFEEEGRGEYISGRVKDLTTDKYEIIRTAVPINVNGETVGILYGVIKLDAIEEKYNRMAEELDIQLFVYDTETGNLIIDTVHDNLGNISFMENREYNDGYSYEQMMSSENGFTSFKSAYRDENLYVRYSTLEDIGWKITLARYESQVFEKTHIISRVVLIKSLVAAVIVSLYIVMVMQKEKQRSNINQYAAEIRKLLLEINQQNSSIFSALERICSFAKSRSAVYFDSSGDNFHYANPAAVDKMLKENDKKYLISEVLRYPAEIHEVSGTIVNLMCIKPNKHLEKTNNEFYEFLIKHNIKDVSFASIIDKKNRVSVLGVINPRNGKAARTLLKDIVVCFSIALYNKRHLNKTEIAAITDTLTGVLNRVAFKKDILRFDEEKPEMLTCIYIDANELHYRNNKYGHSAGDEMLLYIANTLKEVFYGQKIYRMGGDEFLVFAASASMEEINKGIDILEKQLEAMDYHVAIGVSYRTQDLNIEELVGEAENRMYEAKAKYYQDKEKKNMSDVSDKGFVYTKTGISEIDALISVLKEKYNGIYCVDLNTDKVHMILTPAYLGYNETEEHFSSLISKYIYDLVTPEFDRALINFLNYDALKKQLSEGSVPMITYKKTNGDTMVLSIYKLDETDDSVYNTLWVFSREKSI